MKLSNYKMINGYLLVKALPTSGEDKKSGIYLPVEKDDELQTSRCEVMLVAEDIVTLIKPGDKVFFSKLVPDSLLIDIDGEETELWFVHSKDVKMIEHANP